MPYIKKQDREKFEDVLLYKLPDTETSGELNYLITMVCQNYLHSKGVSYQTFNDIIGALEGSKLELYRRQLSVYEDKKIIENGDVYD